MDTDEIVLSQIKNLKSKEQLTLIFTNQPEKDNIINIYNVLVNQEVKKKIFLKKKGLSDTPETLIITYDNFLKLIKNELDTPIFKNIIKITLESSKIVSELNPQLDTTQELVKPKPTLSEIPVVISLDNLVFDIDTSIGIVIEEKISKWKQKLDNTANTEELTNLLHILSITYDKTSIDNHIQDYINLTEKHTVDIDYTQNKTIIPEINVEKYKPYYEKICNNDFRNTNIYPIVSDNQVLYIDDDNDELCKLSAELKKLKAFKHYTVKKESDDFYAQIEKEIKIREANYANNNNKINKFAELEQELLINNFNKSHIFSTNDKLQYFTVNLHDNITVYRNNYKKYKKKHVEGDVKKTAFLNLNFKVADSKDGKTSETFLSINADDLLNVNNYNNIITRKARKSIYTLKDNFSDVKLNKKKGLKNIIKTCNGTSKTGEKIYYDNNLNSEINNSLNEHPVKKLLQITENKDITNICGFYIKSPYRQSAVIINGEEKIVEDTVKYYPDKNSRGLNLTNTQSNLKPKIQVIENINSFNIYNYNPHLDYFILFGKNDQNQKLTNKQYNDNINKILPSIVDILFIERENFVSISSITEIELIINKYGLKYRELPREIKKYLNINILKNVTKIKNSTDVIDKININETLYNYIFKILNNIFSKTHRHLSEDALFDTVKSHVISEITEHYWGNFINNINNILKLTNETDLTNIERSFKTFLYKEIDNYKLQSNIISNIILESDEFANIDSHLYYVLQRFTNLNKFHYAYRYSFNKRFTNYEMGMLDMFKKYQNNYNLSQQFLNVLQLQNIYTLNKQLNTYSSKYIDIDGKISLLNIYTDRLMLIKDLYNDYITMTKLYENDNGLIISKYYTSYGELTSDNTKESIYIDSVNVKYIGLSLLLFDNLNKERKLKEQRAITIDELETYIKNIFIFINRIILEEFITNIKYAFDYDTREIQVKEFSLALLTLEEQSDSVSGIVTPKKDCDLGDGRYLFERVSNTWKCVNRSSYTDLQESMNYKLITPQNSKFLLHISLDEWLSLVELETYQKDMCEDGIELDGENELINIFKDNEKYVLNDIILENIPIFVYKFFKSINNLNTKINKLQLLKQYSDEIDLKKNHIKKQLDNKIKYAEDKNTKILNLTKRDYVKPIKKLRQAPGYLKTQLISILNIGDFDTRIDELYQFININGADYSSALHEKISMIYRGELILKPLWELQTLGHELNSDENYHTIYDKDIIVEKIIKQQYPEAYPKLSKKIYHHSINIDEPICCKHYLSYKPMLYKTGCKRTEVLESIVSKFGIQREGIIICKDCGEVLDYEKYSNFEGFNSENKVIISREAVDDDEPIFNIKSPEYSKQAQKLFMYSVNIINKICTSFDIGLFTKDSNFILQNIHNEIKNEGSLILKQILTENISKLLDIEKNSNKSFKANIRRAIKSDILLKGPLGQNSYRVKTKQITAIFNSQFSEIKTSDRKGQMITDDLLMNTVYNNKMTLVINKILDKVVNDSVYGLNTINIKDMCKSLKKDFSDYSIFDDYYKMKHSRNPIISNYDSIIPKYYKKLLNFEQMTSLDIQKKYLFHFIYLVENTQLNVNELYVSKLSEKVLYMTVNYISKIIVYSNPEYKIQINLIDSVNIKKLASIYSPDSHGNSEINTRKLEEIIINDIIKKYTKYYKNSEENLNIKLNKDDVAIYDKKISNNKYFKNIKRERFAIYQNELYDLTTDIYKWDTFLPNLNHEIGISTYDQSLNTETKLNIESFNYIALLNRILSTKSLTHPMRYINNSLFDSISNNYTDIFLGDETTTDLQNVFDKIKTLSSDFIHSSENNLFTIENYSNKAFTTITSLSEFTHENLKVLLNTYSIKINSTTGEDVSIIDIIDEPLNKLLTKNIKLQKRHLVNINSSIEYSDIINIDTIKDSIQLLRNSGSSEYTDNEITLFDSIEGVLMTEIYDKFKNLDIIHIKKIFTLINNINKVPTLFENIQSDALTFMEENKILHIENLLKPLNDDLTLSESFNNDIIEQLPEDMTNIKFAFSDILDRCINKLNLYYEEYKITMKDNYKMSINITDEELLVDTEYIFRRNNIEIHKNNTKLHIFLKILQNLLQITSLITNENINEGLYELLNIPEKDEDDSKYGTKQNKMCIYTMKLNKSHCNIYNKTDLGEYLKEDLIPNLANKYSPIYELDYKTPPLNLTGVSGWDKIIKIKTPLMNYVNKIKAKYDLKNLKNTNISSGKYTPEDIIETTEHLIKYVITLYSGILDNKSIDSTLSDSINKLLNEFKNDIENTTEIYSVTNIDIFDDITLYRTHKSDTRKKQHDKLPEEQQNAKKMFRLFNIGKMYKMLPDETISEELMTNESNIYNSLETSSNVDDEGISSGSMEENESLSLNTHSVEEDGDPEY